MSVPAAPPAPSRSRGRVRRGRLLTAALALLLLAFSPTVAFYLGPLLGGPSRLAPTLPPAPVGEATAQGVRAYALTAPEFARALSGLRVGERRRLALSQEHYRTYLQARRTLGPAKASVLMGLLAAEVRNQDPALGRRSVYGSPEAALRGAGVWLAFLAHAVSTRPGDRTLARLSPVPLVPEAVRFYAPPIRRAANALHLAPGMLAAILDNERAGGRSGLGLAGWLRDFTDTVALRVTEAYGGSGATGRLSQTVGLTQMGWEDATRQEERLRSLDVRLSGPSPRSEAQARAALARPGDHFLLSGSRLRGYVGAALGPNPANLTDARAYFVGPGWHNNPALASSGQTWPYAWNAFFKACLYEKRLFAGE